MPARRERLVQADLVGGQRLDLDDLVGAVRLDDRRRRSRWPRRASRAQCTWPPAAGHRRLELLEVARRGGAHRAPLIARARLAQRLPVGDLRDDRARAWRGSSVVALPRLRRSWVLASASRADAAGKRPSSLIRRALRSRRGSRRGASCARRPAGARQPAADVHQARVVGRAVQTSARVSSTHAQLVGRASPSTCRRSSPRTSRRSRSTPRRRAARRGRCPRTARSRRSGRVADAAARAAPWQVGW